MPQMPVRTILPRKALAVASQMHANVASSKTVIAHGHGNYNAVTQKRTAAAQFRATKEERMDVGLQSLAVAMSSVTTSTVIYVVVASKRVAMLRTMCTMGTTDITATMATICSYRG